MRLLLLGLLASTAIQAEVVYSAAQTRQIKTNRQQEAKTALRSVYTAEQAFYAEYGTYWTYLDKMGVLPLRGEHNYVVGFSRGSAANAQVTASFPQAFGGAINSLAQFMALVTKYNGSLNFFPEVDPITNRPTGVIYSFWFNPDLKVEQTSFQVLANQFCGSAACSADANGFRAIAIGNIDSDAGLDVWTINQSGQLINLVNDAN